MNIKFLRNLILFLALISLIFISDQVFLMDQEENYDPFTPTNKITEDDGVDFPVDI